MWSQPLRSAAPLAARVRRPFISRILLFLCLLPDDVPGQVGESGTSSSGARMTTLPPAGGTYLVTGSAGFIGSHLVEALLARGDEVVGLDNFDPFYDPALKLRNIQAACQSPGFRMVAGDIRDGAVLERLFRDHRFDAVVHLAARAGVRPSLAEPVLYDAVNVAGTTSVLEYARRFEVDRLVLASSSSVYGATSVPPFKEADAADRPSSPYAATKRANEVAAYAFHHLYGAHTTCLRF